MNFTKLLATFVLIYAADACSKNKNSHRFELEYQWIYLNYTWESEDVYKEAVDTNKYIPDNNAMTSIKFYKDRFYIAMLRLCEGTPVPFGYISTSEDTPKLNPLITPFPDWGSTHLTEQTCDQLEGVQSMEIDADGILWVLDGVRLSPRSKCPAKLVLYDLNDEFKIIQNFTLPEEICRSRGCFLNDLVVDSSDGGDFAYITETGDVDPGLIIYSRNQNRAWKIRDASMFAELAAANFTVDGMVFSTLTPIDGVALSPLRARGSRILYFSAVTGFNLHSISTDILKSEEICSGSMWRFNVTTLGQKQAQGDGMVMDNMGNLYYGLLPLYAVGRWNSRKDLARAGIVDQNRDLMIWTDCFTFDDKGYLYLLANNLFKYLITSCTNPTIKRIKGAKFRIFKYYTGTNSYLHY